MCNNSCPQSANQATVTPRRVHVCLHHANASRYQGVSQNLGPVGRLKVSVGNEGIHNGCCVPISLPHIQHPPMQPPTMDSFVVRITCLLDHSAPLGGHPLTELTHLCNCCSLSSDDRAGFMWDGL